MDFSDFTFELYNKIEILLKEYDFNYNPIIENSRDIKQSFDIEIEKLIINELKIFNKKTKILAEECYDKTELKGNVWIIDPIDGTFNFIKGFPSYCISIAYWENLNPIFGSIYNLFTKEIYQSNITDLHSPSKVSNTSDIQNSVLATGFPIYMDFSEDVLLKMLKRIAPFKKIRMIGSAALSLAYVASGVFDAYYEEQIKIWDVAAGLALVKAAGGSYIMKPGSSKHSYIVAATNGKINPKIFFEKD